MLHDHFRFMVFNFKFKCLSLIFLETTFILSFYDVFNFKFKNHLTDDFIVRFSKYSNKKYFKFNTKQPTICKIYCAEKIAFV